MNRVAKVSWSAATVGAVSGVALTIVFVIVVGPVLVRLVSPMPEYLAYGLMLLFVSAFRAVAGMWTAMRLRSRYDVDERTDFLPTAAVAGALGWAMYLLITAVVGSWTGTEWWSVRAVLESLRWVAEYVVGALLVDTVRPEAGHRAMIQRRRQRDLRTLR